MAIQNILPDLTHIARTTYQWEHTADKYEIIPNGVLCIEFVTVDQTLIKIGDGHHIYKQLPYVSSIDLKNYYTKEETDNRIIEIFNDLKSIRIKGEVSDLSHLPTDNNTEGDLWFVKRTSPTGYSRYDEYVWYKNNWESIGLSESDIDLSEYAKKEYVDEKIEEVDEKIDRYMHTHSNKEILDQITAPFTTEKDEKLESLHNYDDTEIRRIIDERTHTHSNKSILDQISAAYTTDKDNKLASLHNYDDTAVQDRLEILERIAHFHENQEILDRTTAAFTREQAITLLDCKDFEGTDGTDDGYHGFVPAPTAADAGKVLGANGQWVPMSGGGGGDTVAEGGGISITTDAQTGNKVIAVNAGTGLTIDPQTGELNVTGGGSGDTVAEGSGITITTDSQTGDKVISVDTGNGLQIDEDGAVAIDESILPEVPELEAGVAISIEDIEQGGVTYDAWNSGTGWENVCYQSSVGDSVVAYTFEAHSPISNSYEIPAGATKIRGVAYDNNDTLLWVSYSWLDSNNHHYASLSPEDGHYNEWYDIPSDAVKVNFGVRHSKLDITQAMSLNDIKSVDITCQIEDPVIDIWNNGDGWIKFAYTGSSGDTGISGWGSEVHSAIGQGGIPIPDGATKVKVTAIKTNSDPTQPITLLWVYSSWLDNNYHRYGSDYPRDAYDGWLDLDPDAKYINFGIRWSNGSNTTISLTDIESVTLEWDNVQTLITSKQINVLYGDGLTVNQDNELEVNIGTGLSINQDGEIEADQYTLPIATASTLGGIKVGDGLTIDANGVLSADGGGSGDSIAEGGGIEITTDPQTGVKTISVDVGDNLEIDPQTGELNVTGVDYSAGKGIYIGAEYKFIEYIKNSGNYDQIILTDIVPGFSDKIEVDMKIGAAVAATVWDEPIFGCTGSTPSSYRYSVNVYLASNDSNISCYNHFTYTSGNTGSNFFIRPSGVSYDGSGAQRQILTMSGSTATLGNASISFSNEVDNSFIDPQIGIAIFGNITDTGTKNYFNQCNLTIYGIKLYDSNNTLLHNLVPVERLADNEGGLYDTITNKFYGNSGNGSFIKGPETTPADDRIINAKIGDGLQFDSNNAIEVNVGNGLYIDSTDNDINVKYGDGLTLNSSNELEVNVGQRLKIEQDGSVNAKGYIAGTGISIDLTDYSLPSGYTRIKALSSTLNGNQYINTGYRLNPNSEIDMKCTLYKRETSVWAIPLGARVYNQYAVGGLLFVTTNSDSLVPSTGVDTPSLWIESSLNYPPAGQIELWYNDIVNLHFDNQSVTCENQRTLDQSVITSQTAISTTSNYDLYVFATNNGNNAEFFGVMDLYELTISENNTIIHRYIPCKRDSDDKYGLYDIIDDEFKLSPNNNLFSYVAGLPLDDVNETISLLPATEDSLGGVKIGAGLLIDEDGTLDGIVYEAGQGIELSRSVDGFAVRNTEYYFDYRVSCQINGNYGPRTYTRVSTDEPCVIAIVQTTASNQVWTAPACVGLTADACKYTNSYDSTVIGPDETFYYRGQTWYIAFNYALTGSSGVDLMGGVPSLDLTSIDTTGNAGLYHVGIALLEAAGLISPVTSQDVWNGGTGWLNGDYTSGSSDSFVTNWYYTYHYNPSEYIPIPEGATKVKVYGISTENDTLFQGGGVNAFDSNHHHTNWVNCVEPGDFVDIPAGVVYVQPEVKWNNQNTRTISGSDIKSVALEFYIPMPDNSISAKIGDGLEFDSNNAIQAKLGNGLGFDSNGAIEVTGGGGGDSIDEGNGITITTDPLTDVKTIAVNAGEGLTFDPVTGALMFDGQLPEGTVIKKMTYIGDGASSNVIHFDKKPLGILALYGMAVGNKISAVPTVINATCLMSVYGSGGSSDRGGTVVCSMSYNDSTNELTLSQGLDAGARYNVSGETYQMFYLTKGHTGSGTSTTNEVSVVKTFSYVGTGTSTNNIQFPETPDMLVAISAPGDDNTRLSSVPTAMDADKLIIDVSDGNNNNGVIGCSMSFNSTTNVLTLSTTKHVSWCMNMSGTTYTVFYSVNETLSASLLNPGDGIDIDSENEISVKYGDGLTVNQDNELEVNLGSGLSFDANGAIQVTGGGGGGGDTVAQGNGINITTDQQTGDKVISVNAGNGLQINQTTHALEATGVTSIAPTSNTPGSITLTNGDGTTTPVSVISQMGGAGASTAGSAGYVPAPASGDNDAYLRGDGVWDDDVLTENDELTITFVPDDYQPT